MAMIAECKEERILINLEMDFKGSFAVEIQKIKK